MEFLDSELLIIREALEVYEDTLENAKRRGVKRLVIQADGIYKKVDVDVLLTKVNRLTSLF